MTRKTDYAFWTFMAMAGLAGATSVFNVSRTYSATSQNSEIYKQLDLFGDVLERVRNDYVEKPDDSALIDAAINGMLASLDPHSSYMNAKSFKDMQVQTRGEFGGLGIEVTMENGVIKVVSPIDETPAQKAGVLSNDLITHLDGEQIVGLSLEQSVEKMRGLVNTPITLTIVRKGRDEPFDLKITRDVIKVQAVKSRLEGDVIYTKISTFNEQTHSNLTKQVDALKKQATKPIKGYIVDLRNDPGGLLDQAIAVSDDFLEKGAIVLTKGRNLEETQRANARPGDITDGKTIIVLINGGSASASEIVAGALQDHKRATIVGTRSFGKGSVQTIIPLGQNGALRLTTARYYTPSGRSIQAKGIDPDIVVENELPAELKPKVPDKPRGEANLKGHLKGDKNADKDKKDESGSSSYVPKEPEKDTQLQVALKLARGETVDVAKMMETAKAEAAIATPPAATAPAATEEKKPEEKKQ
jgi:carboxyl-terminal processing protease